MHRPSLTALLFTAIFTVAAHAIDPPPQRQVMTWVPPYATDKCLARLNESFDGLGMKDGLTDLGLQFWAPTKSGGLERVKKYDALTDAKVFAFRDWAHARHIRVLLCVYNGVNGWDWPLAHAAFADHRQAFVEALLAEMERLGLDGIDIDLEGNGSLAGSKDSFVQFVTELSARLRAAGKHLTLDTFAYQWNAPNQTWWPKLLPLVDGLTTMGYEETGAGAPEWRAYSAQKAAAGIHAAKLLLGMPGDKSTWQKHDLAHHLGWVADDPDVGLAIWDAQLSAAAWRSHGVWEKIARIRDHR